MKKIHLLKARLAYVFAKLKARQLNRIKGTRHFVVATDDARLVVMDKAVFYKLRKRKAMPKSVKPRMLTQIAVWYTKGMYCGKPSPEMPKSQAAVKLRRYLAYVKGKR